MKNKLLIILLMALSPYCYASMYPLKSFSFDYTFKGEHFPIVIQNASYDDALEEAAVRCFNYFSKSKGNEKINLPDDMAMDLIDECANPSKGGTDIKRS
jgi:hypothetical protein